MNQRTTKLATLGIMCAMAYMVMAVGRFSIFPSAPFLNYDPKDIIIIIGGFIFGPLSAAMMSIVVSLVEMVTVSDTGPIGLIMNVLSTCTFACTAALIYKKKQTMAGALVGLLCGVAAMTATMLLWNFFITPIYMGVPREAVTNMLLPVFLPFNLIKGGLNAAVTLLLYKPIVTALRASKLLPESTSEKKGKINLGVLLAALLIIVTCILVILVFNGVI